MMITIKDFLNLVIQISTFPLPFAIRRLIFLAQGHSLSKKSYIAPFSFVLANKLVFNVDRKEVAILLELFIQLISVLCI